MKINNDQPPIGPPSGRKLIGTSTVEFDEEKTIVVFQLYNGRRFRVDLSHYNWRSPKQATDFIMKLIDGTVWDSIILSNLRPELEDGHADH